MYKIEQDDATAVLTEVHDRQSGTLLNFHVHESHWTVYASGNGHNLFLNREAASELATRLQFFAEHGRLPKEEPGQFTFPDGPANPKKVTWANPPGPDEHVDSKEKGELLCNWLGWNSLSLEEEDKEEEEDTEEEDTDPFRHDPKQLFAVMSGPLLYAVADCEIVAEKLAEDCRDELKPYDGEPVVIIPIKANQKANK